MKTSDEQDELNLVTLAKEYSDENKARVLLESLRWPDGPVCPHCRNRDEKPIYRLQPKEGSKASARRGILKCGACRKQFSVTVGTVFEGSHIPIGTWLLAVFIFCTAKKSVSANQLHRTLGVTYKTAWFMAHRIRFAMAPQHDDAKLDGTVEVDETYIGPRSDVKHSQSSKHVLVALIQRDGKARTHVLPNVNHKNVGYIIRSHVDKASIINTDESAIYKGKLKDFAGHQAVNHSKYEYSRQESDGSKSSTNTAESFFSLFKRGIVGSWHHVSLQHLPKYADEFTFRWDRRKHTDGEKLKQFVPGIEGRRLTYRQVV